MAFMTHSNVDESTLEWELLRKDVESVNKKYKVVPPKPQRLVKIGPLTDSNIQGME